MLHLDIFAKKLIKDMKNYRLILAVTLLMAMVAFQSCDDDDVPAPENEEEVIDQVVLTFTPTGGAPITFTATDPDGEGSADFAFETIALDANTIYTLSIGVFNTEEGENITEEIEEEDDEHMFFFGFTSGLFTSPTGDGNLGGSNRNDPMNYDDEDADGNPIGLSTVWETGEAASGTFRVVLKHQPGIKTANSSSEDGETDIDLTWSININ